MRGVGGVGSSAGETILTDHKRKFNASDQRRLESCEALYYLMIRPIRDGGFIYTCERIDSERLPYIIRSEDPKSMIQKVYMSVENDIYFLLKPPINVQVQGTDGRGPLETRGGLEKVYSGIEKKLTIFEGNPANLRMELESIRNLQLRLRVIEIGEDYRIL